MIGAAMTTKTKSRNGANRAASNTTDTRNSIASRIKALIVNLALWGGDSLRPVGVADPALALGGRMMTGDIGRIREALQFIPASDRDTWVKMGMAIMRYAYIRCAA